MPVSSALASSPRMTVPRMVPVLLSSGRCALCCEKILQGKQLLLTRRCSHGDAAERCRFVQPSSRWREIPGEAVAAVPFDRAVIEVDELYRRREYLDPVAVRVAEIDVEGVALPVAAGTTFEALREADSAGRVQGAQQAPGLGDYVAKMMQHRPRPRQEHHVVRVVLAVQE